MCETRNELKQSRVAHKQTQSVNDEQQETQEQASTPTLQRGSGPRDKAAASAPQVKRGRGRPAKAAISSNL